MLPQSVSFSGVTARYIAIDVDDNWGHGNLVGIGEVQFFTPPATVIPPAPLDPPPVGPLPADLNQNGIPDLAEIVTPAIAEFPPAEDTDGDGVSNLDETKTGTDPFDKNSYFGPTNIAYTTEVPEGLDFTFNTVSGVRYRVEMSELLDSGSWSTITPLVIATGDETTVSYSLETLGEDLDRCFFRASVLPSLDTDSDGLEDNLELYLGFDPTSANSVRANSEGGDYTQFFRLMTGAASNGGLYLGGSSGVPSDEQAGRFFSQAGFGANQQMIDGLRALGNNPYEQWIDQQLTTPTTKMEPYTSLLRSMYEDDQLVPDPEGGFYHSLFTYALADRTFLTERNAHTAWMRHALFAPDILRKRVSWALSQILVANGLGDMTTNTRYYDLITEYALEDYEELLYQVSINPYMARFLSSANNKKADPSINRMPDENFAREIMQLFSIGLWELNMDGTRRLDVNNDPIPSYTNADITQVARVFTGLEYDPSGPTFISRYSNHPMNMDNNDHDQGDATMVSVYGMAEKTFLQSSFYSPPSLPPGQTGLQDIRDTVEILVNHPNCPPFISKNLIQHMVTSNPSPAYVERVANVFVDDGTGKRGNLGAVVKAILMDEEARSLHHQLSDNHGRLKAPVLRFVSMIKALNAGSATPALYDLTGIQYWNPSPYELVELTGQGPYGFPSVFNFFEPGYSRPGEISDADLVSPEFQILNARTSITMPNHFWVYIEDGRIHRPGFGTPPDFSLQTADLEAMAGDRDALLDELNLLLCHGRLGSNSRSVIKSALDTLATSLSSEELIKHAIYFIMTCPDGAVLN